MNIAIREARTTDIPAVAEMFDLYRQFYEQPPDPPLAQQFIADRLNKQGCPVSLRVTELGT
jgi:hypothetical protein